MNIRTGLCVSALAMSSLFAACTEHVSPDTPDEKEATTVENAEAYDWKPFVPDNELDGYLLGRDRVSLGVSAGDRAVGLVRGESPAALPDMLAHLARVEPGGFEPSWQTLRAIAGRRVDRLFVLSDMLFEEPEQDRLLRLMAAAGRAPVLLHVMSRVELEPDLRQSLELLDTETGERLLVPGGARAAKAYLRHLEAWLKSLRARCRRLGVTYVGAHTTAPVAELMRDGMQRARLVGARQGGVA